MRTRATLQIVVVSLLLVACCNAVAATSLEKMSMERMAGAAQMIVRARCVANATQWDAGEIWTFTTFEVSESWKGAASQRVTVRLLGGTVGGLTSHVSGVPRFRVGEEVILFLEPTRRADFTVVSWQQGTFRIGRDQRSGVEIVTQDTAAFETFDPVTRQFRTAGIRNLLLDDFRARVMAAITQPGRQS